MTLCYDFSNYDVGTGMGNRVMQLINRFRVLLLAPLLLGACQSFSADAPSTLEADISSYGTEVAVMRQNSQDQQTQVAATVQFAETQAAGVIQYNSILLATVRAGGDATPVPQTFANTNEGPLALSIYDTSDGIMRFEQTGTSGFVRPQDRCFESHQNFFTTSSTDAIYFVAVGLNMSAGTNIDVTWYYEGAIQHRSSYTAPNFVEAQCVAVPLTRGDANLLPGNWSASVTVNGQILRESIPFTVLEG